MLIDPETQLDEAERASVVSILDLPGFHALQKLMLIEIAKFDLALKNADPADNKKVLAAHVIAKAASQFYTQIIDRLNGERDYFRGSHNQPKVQPSGTDELTED